MSTFNLGQAISRLFGQGAEPEKHETKMRAALEERFLNAAEQSNVDEVRFCIYFGVNVNCSRDGYTALHLASERSDMPLALILFTCKNLNIEPTSFHGYTPLHVACLYNQVKMVRFLLKNGVNPNTTDRLQETALHMAAHAGSIIMVQLLFKYGAKVNVIDVMQRTPLHRAVVDDYFLPMAKLLIQHGANVNIYTGHMSLFLECVLNCHTEHGMDAVEFLISNGANVKAVDMIARRNALHLVALTGYYKLVPILLKAGVDPTKKDYTRKTPVDIAFDHRNKEVVFLLQRHKVISDTDVQSSIVDINVNDSFRDFLYNLDEDPV